MTTAYLATPIDLHRESGVAEMRETIRDELFEMGFSAVFDPSSAWTIHTNSKPNPGLQQVNLAALGAADALIAYLPEGVPTLGVPLEIHYASQMGKPVLIYTDMPQSSWTLAWFGRGGNVYYRDELERFVQAVARATGQGGEVDPTEQAKRDRALLREQARSEMMGR